MPQFSAAVCYSFTSSSIHRHVGWCRHSIQTLCGVLCTHTHKHARVHAQIQALSLFLWAELVPAPLVIIFGLIVFCVCLFSIMHTLYETRNLWILMSQWRFNTRINTLVKDWSVLSSRNGSPSLLVVLCLTVSVSRAPSLFCLISCDGFKCVRWEVY